MAVRNSIQDGLRRVSQGFVPFQVQAPPPGLYDPSIDAQVGAGNRGLGDLQQDTNTQNLRDTTDYGLGHDAIMRTYDRGTQDLGVQQGELNTARQRAAENYGQSTQDLGTQYGRQADAQRQAQSRAGVTWGSGAMAQALGKRGANQAHDQAGLNTSYARTVQDQAVAQGRLDTAGTRAGEDRDLSLGDLALKLAPPDAGNPLGGRSFQDRTTALTRAQREGVALGLDATAQRAYQAAGAGWVPPVGPSNEFTDAEGNPYQVRTAGHQVVAYDPSGRALWRRARKG